MFDDVIVFLPQSNL